MSPFTGLDDHCVPVEAASEGDVATRIRPRRTHPRLESYPCMGAHRASRIDAHLEELLFLVAPTSNSLRVPSRG